MHFHVLVEDLSGKLMLDILLKKIIGPNHTFKTHPHRGKGHLPDTNRKPAPNNPTLLGTLPNQLRAYGKSFVDDQTRRLNPVIVVCDLDDLCFKEFRTGLMSALESCTEQPIARFCIAVKEGEAWLLGDTAAIKTAYPSAKTKVLTSCMDENISGTWEKLADAIYPGGSEKMKLLDPKTRGVLKSEWAERITPHMDIDRNKSPSFQYFVKKLRELAA